MSSYREFPVTVGRCGRAEGVEVKWVRRWTGDWWEICEGVREEILKTDHNGM